MWRWSLIHRRRRDTMVLRALVSLEGRVMSDEAPFEYWPPGRMGLMAWDLAIVLAVCGVVRGLGTWGQVAMCAAIGAATVFAMGYMDVRGVRVVGQHVHLLNVWRLRLRRYDATALKATCVVRDKGVGKTLYLRDPRGRQWEFFSAGPSLDHLIARLASIGVEGAGTEISHAAWRRSRSRVARVAEWAMKLLMWILASLVVLFGCVYAVLFVPAWFLAVLVVLFLFGFGALALSVARSMESGQRDQGQSDAH